jgi:iron-sulfur cluster repair protein YtfE (RIC family)
MESIRSYLSKDHRHCDETLAKLELLASKNNWSEVEIVSEQLKNELNRHFTCEETILFPSFEETTGMTNGPTAVMRMEHVKMRELLGEISPAVSAKNTDRLFGLTETLMILIQQHNSKEEQMLYNMCDSYLGDQIPELISQMEKILK